MNPTPASSSAIAALLARSLALGQGELMLQLSSHNLQHKTLVSLLEDPDSSARIDPSLVILPLETLQRVVATLTAIAGDISAELSVAHNPFDATGRLAAAVTPVGKTQNPSCVNEDAAEMRWRGRTLRLLVRRIPDSPEEISECRVAVVGNVVRLCST